MEKQTVMEKLKNAKELFVLMSVCTRMPYVACDEETFDDEILVYFTDEDIKREGKRYIEKKIPVQIAKVDLKQRLGFFANLYTMGINAILADEGMESETRIQLSDFVRRPMIEQGKDGKLPDGKLWIENPGLHLTALYFMQEVRRQKLDKLTPELMEQQEEILADFNRGTFLMALHAEGKGIPLIKQQNGDAYQPVFTDMLEFQKFNRTKQFKAAGIQAAKVPEVLAKEAKGVAVNPMGINLLLPILRKTAAPAEAPKAATPADIASMAVQAAQAADRAAQSEQEAAQTAKVNAAIDAAMESVSAAASETAQGDSAPGDEPAKA